MRWIWIDRFEHFESGKSAVAVKAVTAAEEQLHHLYPDFPVYPASLVVEGFAQTAGILVGEAGDFAEKVVLAKIGRADFSRLIRPGDVLRFSAQIDTFNPAGASTSGTVALATGEPVASISMMFSPRRPEPDRCRPAAGKTSSSPTSSAASSTASAAQSTRACKTRAPQRGTTVRECHGDCQRRTRVRLSSKRPPQSRAVPAKSNIVSTAAVPVALPHGRASLRCVFGAIYPAKRRTTSVSFWPPKPKLLVSTTSSRSTRRAALGT